MTDRKPNPHREPRSEPEIIPPGHSERMYVAKFGPLSSILLILVAGLLSTVLMVLLFGALLIALPALVLFFTAIIVAGLLRIYFQRPH
jgi:hypothetical protein